MTSAGVSEDVETCTVNIAKSSTIQDVNFRVQKMIDVITKLLELISVVPDEVASDLELLGFTQKLEPSETCHKYT